MPRFDVDLCRVSREHYITGKASINFPWPATTTGGWHHLSYWDRDAGQVKVSLAGIHYPTPHTILGSLASGKLAKSSGAVVGRSITGSTLLSQSKLAT